MGLLCFYNFEILLKYLKLGPASQKVPSSNFSREEYFVAHPDPANSAQLVGYGRVVTILCIK